MLFGDGAADGLLNLLVVGRRRPSAAGRLRPRLILLGLIVTLDFAGDHQMFLTFRRNGEGGATPRP